TGTGRSAKEPASLQLPNPNGAGISVGDGRNAHTRQNEQSNESNSKSRQKWTPSMGQLSTLGEAGKASIPPLLSIRPDYGNDCHKDIESNHCTQPCKEDLVAHGFPSLWPFLIESALPALSGHP